MNKLVKGSIAGAAGIALLLGGAGTFALWSDSATVSAQSITAGHLDLTADTAGVWTVNGTTINPVTYKVVPGTTLVFKQTLGVNAVGNGLAASLSYSGLTEQPGGLEPYITPSLVVKYNGTTVTGSSVNIVSGASTIDVELSLVFSATGQQGMDEALTLSNLVFTLSQV